MARGRGRPKKVEEAQSDCVVAGGLTGAQLQSLGQAIDMVPAVGDLPAAERQVLLEAIGEVLPHYATSGEAYRRGFPKKRGPRLKFQRAHLLIDGQRAWERATGRRAGLSVTPGDLRASIPVQLARAVLPVVSRDRLSLSAWRSQCDVARSILTQAVLA